MRSQLEVKSSLASKHVMVTVSDDSDDAAQTYRSSMLRLHLKKRVQKSKDVCHTLESLHAAFSSLKESESSCFRRSASKE